MPIALSENLSLAFSDNLSLSHCLKALFLALFHYFSLSLFPLIYTEKENERKKKKERKEDRKKERMKEFPVKIFTKEMTFQIKT